VFTAKNTAIESLAKKWPDRIALLDSVLAKPSIVYINYANVRGWTKKLGWAIDFKVLKHLLDSFGVMTTRFYFGNLPHDAGSQAFMTMLHRTGYEIRTKPVKIMTLSIDVTSISSNSPDILANFIDPTLLRELRIDAIESLNNELRAMNVQGKKFLEKRKCNFDVEIASDLRVAHLLKKTESFCLWSGDSDFADPLREVLNDGKDACVIAPSGRISSELNALRVNNLKIIDFKKLRQLIERII
jgi:uncharacterized LabA/DUF88 family protein